MKTTEQQAQTLAVKAIEEYVRNCQCDTPEDVAKVMMKMTGTAERALQGIVGTPKTIYLLTRCLEDMKKNPGVILSPLFEVAQPTTKH